MRHTVREAARPRRVVWRAGAVWLAAAAVATAAAVLGTPRPAAAQTVMGYFPYWESGAASLPFDVLDVVAYFGAPVNAAGDVTGTNGWPGDPEVAALLAGSAAAGTKVVLSVTNFSPTSIGSLVGSPAARANFIAQIVPLVLDAGGNGVDIDFESVDTPDRDAFTTFMTELAAAFHAADPESHVSLAAPAVDWWDSYDVGALLGVVDAMFIMGYNYHYGGGSPGPVAPIAGGGLWSPWINLDATVTDYLALAPPGLESKILLGLPLYGFDWAAASDQPGAAATATGNSVVYASWLAGVAPGDVQWDAESATPWFAYQAAGGGWHQVWCEDATSLAAKMDLALDRGLGGFGFWALGYDGGDPAFWAEVESRAPAVAPGTDAGAPGSDAAPDSDAGAAPASDGADTSEPPRPCGCAVLAVRGDRAGGAARVPGAAAFLALAAAAVARPRRRVDLLAAVRKLGRAKI
jgi:spore germination protein